jgi:hypothetical protein
MGNRNGPPTWFIFLVGIAIVFGIYYLWLGVRGFMASGMTIVESTRQAIEYSTVTAERIEELEVFAPTPLPTHTPVPPCQDFVVDVASAIVRELPTTNSGIADTLSQDEIVCVISKQPDSDWFVIDDNPLTRRLEPVYMHEDIIRALNPTLTPSVTFTPAPTVTNTPTFTPSNTPQSTNTFTPNPNVTPSNTPTPTATETLPSVNL